jgi:oligopeptide transport system permease protein
VLRYALLRIIGAIPTLLLVIALAFLMVHAAPGGPFDAARVLPPQPTYDAIFNAVTT